MKNTKIIKQYFSLKINKSRAIRLFILAVASFIFFSYIIIPIRISGISMEPTYKTGQFRFVNRMAYIFSTPKKGDIVTVKFAGNKVMLLKRVVALAGDTVEFKAGKLFINKQLIREPYVKNNCYWNLKQRKVKYKFIYVIGDNRSMSIESHMFGQTRLKRIEGKVLWQ